MNMHTWQSSFLASVPGLPMMHNRCSILVPARGARASKTNEKVGKAARETSRQARATIKSKKRSYESAKSRGSKRWTKATIIASSLVHSMVLRKVPSPVSISLRLKIDGYLWSSSVTELWEPRLSNGVRLVVPSKNGDQSMFL